MTKQLLSLLFLGIVCTSSSYARHTYGSRIAHKDEKALGFDLVNIEKKWCREMLRIDKTWERAADDAIRYEEARNSRGVLLAVEQLADLLNKLKQVRLSERLLDDRALFDVDNIETKWDRQMARVERIWLQAFADAEAAKNANDEDRYCKAARKLQALLNKLKDVHLVKRLIDPKEQESAHHYWANKKGSKR